MSVLKIGSLYALSRKTPTQLSWDEADEDTGVGGHWPPGAILLCLDDKANFAGKPAYKGLLVEQNCLVYIYKHPTNSLEEWLNEV